MKVKTNKHLAIVFVLMISFATLVTSMSIVSSLQLPNRKTGAFLSVNPKIIGLNQEMTINLWVYPSPAGPHFLGAVALVTYKNITITFTRPDGSKDSFMPVDGSGGTLPGETEPIGAIWFLYKPNQVGTWSVQFSFPGQLLDDKPVSNDTVYYEPSTSPVTTFTVQSQPVQIGLPPVPLPTGFWTRPINSNNREWYQISGAWLQSQYDPSASSFNPYATAPNSPHIVWKNTVSLGGIVGGAWGSLSIEDRTPSRNAIIMMGRVFYPMPGSVFQCVDLRTGELLFEKPGNPTIGHILRAETRDIVRHTQETAGAVITPSLWELTSSQWKRYNPLNGALMQTITNVPSSMSTNWFEGNPQVYCIRQQGWNTTILNRLAVNEFIKWDYNKVTGNNWMTGVVLNKTLKLSDGSGPGEGGRGSNMIIAPDYTVGVVSTTGQNDFYAYDLNTGELLWTKTVDYLNMNSAYNWGPNGVFFTFDSATMIWYGIDIKSGNQLWKSNVVGEYPWGSNAGTRNCAYDMLYIASYDGHIYALDINTGQQKWVSDYTGDTSETVYNTWPFHYGKGVAADGKLYWSTSEHSPTQPRWRGGKMFCIDAFTGKFLWNVSGIHCSSYAGTGAIAEGYLVGTNEYDGIMYCFGKGKTTTTVVAPQTAISKGTSMVISGTVMDMSPAAPGTPAIADAYMSEWMNYLHMQEAEPMSTAEGDQWGKPVNVIGVPVKLTATAPDGSIINIDTVTSDKYGSFGYIWTPPNTGLYKIQATFAGSESYWSSTAETQLGVIAAPSASVSPTPTGTATPTPSTPAPSTPAPSTPTPSATTSPTVAPPPGGPEPSMTLYIVVASVAAAIIVIAALVLVLRRRK